MRLSRSIGGLLLVLLSAGCEEERHVSPRKPASTQLPSPKSEDRPAANTSVRSPVAPLRAFLDEKKHVSSGIEWNREVTSRNGGTISFRVESQGPFAITVVTGQAYKSIMAGEKRPLTQSDVLFTADSQASTFDGKVTIPAGSAYFIIENRDKKDVEFHLQCFPG